MITMVKKRKQANCNVPKQQELYILRFSFSAPFFLYYNIQLYCKSTNNKVVIMM